MDPYTRIYEGTLTFGPKRSGHAMGALSGLDREPRANSVRLWVSHSRDAQGRERVAYKVDGTLVATFVGDPKDGVLGMAYLPDFRTATLQYPGETGALPSLGYLARPEESRLFVLPYRPEERSPGPDPCEGRAGCRSYGMMYGPALGQRYVKQKDASTWQSFGFDGPEMTWTLGPGSPPRKIDFVENVGSGTVNRASLRLVSSVANSGPHDWREGLTRKDHFRVQKGVDAYVGNFDPNMRDPWAHYTRQEGMHRELARKETLPLPTIGLGVLGIVAAVGVVRWRLGRKG